MRKLYKEVTTFRKYVLNEADYESLEFVNFLILFICACAVVNPFTDVFATGKAYEYIKLIMNEQTFGTFLIFLAINSLFALMVGVLKYRLVTTGLQTAVWSILFVFFLAGNAASILSFMPFAFAISSGITFARIWKDIRDKIPSWNLR